LPAIQDSGLPRIPNLRQHLPQDKDTDKKYAAEKTSDEPDRPASSGYKTNQIAFGGDNTQQVDGLAYRLRKNQDSLHTLNRSPILNLSTANAWTHFELDWFF
jgi:hypothetical protein